MPVLFTTAPTAPAVHRRGSCSAGFTIIELMIVVVLVAVLTTLGAPSMAEFVRGMRLATGMSDLRSDLLLARSESIRRNSRVLVCARPSATGLDCATAPTASSWANGWLVCYDTNADGICDAASTDNPNPIRVRAGPAAPLTLTGPIATVTFFPVGNAGGAATFTMTAGTAATRSITLAPSGHLTSSKT